MRICLIGASHPVYDDRMFYREGVSLATRYEVQVVGAGNYAATVKKAGLTATSYPKRRRLRHIELLTNLFVYLRSTSFDVLHCFDLDTLAVAVLASRILSRRSLIVYDAHEHFPSLMAEYFRLPRRLSKVVESLLDIFERYLASFCDAFITVNETLRKRFLPYTKPVLILRNVSSLSWYDNHSDRVLEEITEPIVIFSGNLGWTKGLDTMIQAKEILNNWGIETCFVVTGHIKADSRYPDLTFQKGFKFTGWVDYDILPCFLRRAKVGLALARPSSVNRIIAQPNKLFAYMVAGLPVVATDLVGASEIIKREDCGVLVKPNDSLEIAVALARLLSDEKLRRAMAHNARRAAEREYNWERESTKLLNLYGTFELESSRRNLVR